MCYQFKKIHGNINQMNNKFIKKKRNRYYYSYLSKILKNISDKSGITYNCKQQLNSVICIISKIICDLTIKLTEFSKKKTISCKEIQNSVKIIFPNNLNRIAIKKANKAVNQYMVNKDILSCSRQFKSGIIIPPSITEKFLRGFGYSNTMLTTNSSVYLATVIEYLIYELLENANIIARENNHIRINIRDMELGIRNDTDLNSLFLKYNISFLGGGVKPFIHSDLLVKKHKKSTKMRKTNKHRFRPGTVCLREIRKFQKISNCLTCSKLPFIKLIRELFTKINENCDVKISKQVFIILQYFIEQEIVNILTHANLAAIHARRVKLLPIDIKFVLFVKNGLDNPYDDHKILNMFSVSQTKYRETSENNDFSVFDTNNSALKKRIIK